MTGTLRGNRIHSSLSVTSLMTFRAVSVLLAASMLTLASSSRLWHQMNLLMQIVICSSNNRNYGQREREHCHLQSDPDWEAHGRAEQV